MTCKFDFGMRLRIFHSLNELPLVFANLLSTSCSQSYFDSDSWYRVLVRETLDPRDELRLYGVEDDERQALCLLAACRRRPRGLAGGYCGRRSLASLTNVYSVSFAINCAAETKARDAAIDFLIDGITAERPRWCEIEFRFLDRQAGTFDRLCAALRRNGYIVQQYFQYGNYYRPFVGMTCAEYVAGLRSGIRRTLAQRTRKLERSGCACFELETGGAELERHMADYEVTYRNSWKGDESKPGFIRALIRQSAADGALRLGILYVDGTPAATQLAFTWAGKATMYKTAYDERFSKLGVGGIVIMKVIQHLVDIEHVAEIDFGVGEEAYKQEWFSQRRERWGILALHPLTVYGSTTIFCQVGGKLSKGVSAKISRGMAARIAKRPGAPTGPRPS